MAKNKEEKKKGKAGKTVAGVGILAIIATVLGFGGFGLGFGNGAGSGTGDGNAKNEGSKDAYLMQDDQKPTVVPPATATPIEEQPTLPEPTETVVQLTELAVTINGSAVVYDGIETTAQKLADSLKTEYADSLENVLVKVTLKDAVYDTVEALKVALESKGLKYEILD